MTIATCLISISAIYAVSCLVVFVLILSMNRKDYGRILFTDTLRFMLAAILWLPVLFMFLIFIKTLSNKEK